MSKSFEIFGATLGSIGEISSLMGAYGQAKTAKLNARHQYMMDSINADKQYLADLFAAKSAHKQSVYEAEMMSLQGQAEQASLAHREMMSALNAQRERLNLQHQADMARLSARGQLLAGAGARAKGDHEIARYTRQAGNAEAAQRAALAANGVVLDEGSARELQDGAALMREIDVQTLKHNAINEAMGYQNRAQELMSHAAMREANQHGIMGEYFGSDAVRTQFTPRADMSRYVTRQSVYDQSSAISPTATLFTSLLGAGRNIYAQWDSVLNKKPLK